LEPMEIEEDKRHIGERVKRPVKDANTTYWQKRPKHIEEFLRHFHSLLWFCYRKDFPPMEPSKLTTDIGWGCMLRTGQMMLAEMLIRHSLGADWRLNEKDQLAPFSTYRQILRWFADSPSPKCPYSIHNLVNKSKFIDEKMGANINKVGEWFTPTRVSQIMKHLVREHSHEALTMYVSRDGVVYKHNVEKLCTKSELYVDKSPPQSPVVEFPISKTEKMEDLFWRPIFIVVPVRLGIEKINRAYIPSLKGLLRLSQSIGIIGGRPRQSLYFVGYQDNDALYLDPHIVRPSVRSDQEVALDSYHCSIPGKMPMENIDPSLALGFYCSSKTDFKNFCTSIEELSSNPHPIFTIADKAPRYEEYNMSEDDVVIL